MPGVLLARAMCGHRSSQWSSFVLLSGEWALGKTIPDYLAIGFLLVMPLIANPYPGTEAEAVDVMTRILGDVAIIHSGYRDKKLNGDNGLGMSALGRSDTVTTPHRRCNLRPAPAPTEGRI
jgi:hypothetical protein